MKQKLHKMYHQGIDLMREGDEHGAIQVWLKALALRESYNSHPASGSNPIVGALCSCIDENVNPFKASGVPEN